MLAIDGARGEGGGQILRTSLALSMLTGTPFRMERIRARRRRPGLRRQHLTAVLAAAEICGAAVEGAALGASALMFRPGTVRPGGYRFAVGSAGSAVLVVQTVLPALALAPGPSSVAVEGGTHNSGAPPFEFFAATYVPVVERMGPRIEVVLERTGFAPAGGGRMAARVTPVPRLAPLALLERGALLRRRAVARVAQLPLSIAERELAVLEGELGLGPAERAAETVEDSAGPGNVVLLELESAALTEVVSGVGVRGVRAETVAGAVAREAREYLDADVPVGSHLADQLLLPMALAGGGSYRTLAPTAHTLTHVEVIRDFLGVETRMMPSGGGSFVIEVGTGSR